MLNFWALKISRKENKFAGWFLIAELAGRDLRDLGDLWALPGIFRLFWIVKTNAHLNQATQKNTCQILLRKKIPESNISNPRKSFDHPCHLKSGVTHPWGFKGRFGLKTDIDFAYKFLGNYGSVWTYLSFQFQMNKKERKICKFEIDFGCCSK